jgi:hypothetical protein
MNNQFKKWGLIIFVLVGGIFYIGNSLVHKKDNVSTFKGNQNDLHTWSSTSPQSVMNETDAETNINNIKTIQKEGWKLLMQDGHPISFNGNLSGRNEIIEQSADSLVQGCYELSVDPDGNVVDIKPSEDAKKLLKEQQKQVQIEQSQKQQELEQSEHDEQYNIVQNNITDISNSIEKNGYRFKMSEDGKGTITTWNINNKDDISLSLEYSINKLMDYSISVKSDTEGKIIGFDFAQTDFYEDTFDLYGMTQ